MTVVSVLLSTALMFAGGVALVAVSVVPLAFAARRSHVKDHLGRHRPN